MNSSRKSKTLFIFCLLLMINFGELIANQIETLEKELAIATGERRLRLLDKLSFELTRVDSKRAEKLALEGVELSKTLEDSTALFSIYYNLGRILTSQNRPKEGTDYIIASLNYFRQKKQTRFIGRGNLLLGGISTSKRKYLLADSLMSEAILDLAEAKDTSFLSEAQMMKGHVHYYLVDFPKANWHYQEGLTLAKLIGNNRLITYGLSNLGVVQKRLKQFPQALEYYFQGLDFAESDFDKAALLNNISNVYLKLKDWDSALKYQKEALQIKQKLDFPLAIANSMDNIGIIYRNTLNYGDALKYSKEALAMKEKIKSENTKIENTLNNLGNLYSTLEDYKKASHYYERSLAIYLERNDRLGIMRSYYNIALTAHNRDKNKEGLPLALKSLAIAKELSDLSARISINKLLADIYEALEVSEKSLMYREVYHSLKDSSYNIKNLRKITTIENEHQQKKLSAENEELKAGEGEILLQLQKYKWLLGASLLLLLLSVLFYVRQKQKRKEIEKRSNEKLAAARLKTTEKDLILQRRLDQLQEMLIAQKAEHSKEERSEEPVSQESKTSLNSMSDFLIENLNTEKDWTDFELYFTRVHVDFFKELKTSFPDITPNELNLCALLRLNLLNNEIGEIMGINAESARRAQYRLAKKMNLPSNDELRTYLLKL
ncbi:MAG: tetratricopeptide repeat protein [Saprospiraceae bacterium]